MMAMLLYLLVFFLVAALALYPFWLPKLLHSILKKKAFKIKLKGYFKGVQHMSMVVNNLVHPAWEQMILFISSMTFSRENMK